MVFERGKKSAVMELGDRQPIARAKLWTMTILAREKELNDGKVSWLGGVSEDFFEG